MMIGRSETIKNDQNLIIYFIQGKGLLSPSSTEEQFIIEHLITLQERFTFESPDPNYPVLSSRFTEALSRWEYKIGAFQGKGMRIEIYRYYPDWCIQVHYSDISNPDAFSEFIKSLSERFFSAPIRITYSKEVGSNILDQSSYILSLNESSRIYRTAEFHSATNEINKDEELKFEGLDNITFQRILPQILVIEYDLRIMRRDLQDLISMNEKTRELSVSLETLIEKFVREVGVDISSSYPKLDGLTYLRELLASVLKLRKEITTVACDTFTAALDLNNYAQDVYAEIGENNLLRYYLGQAESCYAKAKLLLAPIDNILERIKYMLALNDNEANRVSARPINL